MLLVNAELVNILTGTSCTPLLLLYHWKPAEGGLTYRSRSLSSSSSAHSLHHFRHLTPARG